MASRQLHNAVGDSNSARVGQVVEPRQTKGVDSAKHADISHPTEIIQFHLVTAGEGGEVDGIGETGEIDGVEGWTERLDG